MMGAAQRFPSSPPIPLTGIGRAVYRASVSRVITTSLKLIPACAATVLRGEVEPGDEAEKAKVVRIGTPWVLTARGRVLLTTS